MRCFSPMELIARLSLFTLGLHPGTALQGLEWLGFELPAVRAFEWGGI